MKTILLIAAALLGSLFFVSKGLIKQQISISHNPSSANQLIQFENPIAPDRLTLRLASTKNLQHDGLNNEINFHNFKKHLTTPGIIFRIQVLSSKKLISADNKIFSGFKDVWVFNYRGIFKYTVGKFKTPSESNSMFNEIYGNGIDDAFLVAFRNDKPISVNQALSELKK